MAPLKSIEFFSDKVIELKNQEKDVEFYANIIQNTSKLIRIHCEDLRDCQLIESRNF